jgi:hypothetical protein
MTVDIKQALVRVQSASGSPVGVGCLIDGRRILTADYVVEEALRPRASDEESPAKGRRGNGDRRFQIRSRGPDEEPAAKVSLDFPFFSTEAPLTGRVVFSTPRPAGEGTYPEGMAVIELDGDPPPQSSPAKLIVAEKLWGHPFRTFGFTSWASDGVWGSGVLRDARPNGLVQLELGLNGDLRGFGGAAIWDESLGGVVGLLVRANSEAKLGFMMPVSVMARQWPALSLQATPPCPYPGARPFAEKDAEFFFGRSAAGADLVARVSNGSVVMVGPSGNGKTSLIAAGVIPRLRQLGGWVIASARIGDQPFRSLAGSIVELLDPGTDEPDRLLGVSKLAAALESGDLSLRDIGDRIRERNSAARFLLVLDQAEELFAGTTDPALRRRFIDWLLTPGGDAGLTLLLSVRADYYPELLVSAPDRSSIERMTWLLPPLTQTELADAVVGPANRVGVRVEPELTDRLVADFADEPAALLFLQIALVSVWSRIERSTLTLVAYERVVSSAHPAAAYMEEIYGGIPEPDRGRIRALLLRLVRLDDEGRLSRRQLRSSELDEDRKETLRRLVEARIVIVNPSSDAPGDFTAELAHEALCRRWGRFLTWVAEDREFLRWVEAVARRSRLWIEEGRNSGQLLEDLETVEAARWLEERPDYLTPLEQDYIRESENAARRRTQARFRRAVMSAMFFLVSFLTATAEFLHGVARLEIAGFLWLASATSAAIGLWESPWGRRMLSRLFPFPRAEPGSGPAPSDRERLLARLAEGFPPDPEQDRLDPERLGVIQQVLAAWSHTNGRLLIAGPGGRARAGHSAVWAGPRWTRRALTRTPRSRCCWSSGIRLTRGRCGPIGFRDKLGTHSGSTVPSSKPGPHPAGSSF